MVAPPVLDGAASDHLIGQLVEPVRRALARRAGIVRQGLPPRPATAAERYRWWRSLESGECRQATLLDHLEVLCGHLVGHPALGFAAEDALPAAALDAADGFVTEDVARLVARYRRILAGQDQTCAPLDSATWRTELGKVSAAGSRWC